MSHTKNVIASISNSIRTIPRGINLARKISPIVERQVQAILDQYGGTTISSKEITSRRISRSVNSVVKNHLLLLRRTKSIPLADYDKLLWYLDTMNTSWEWEYQEVESLDLVKSVRTMIAFLADNALKWLGLKATYDAKTRTTKLVKMDLSRESEFDA